jgi:hypothetical protein
MLLLIVCKTCNSISQLIFVNLHSSSLQALYVYRTVVVISWQIKLFNVQETELDWIKDVKTYQKCPKCKTGDLSSRVPRSFVYKYLVFWATYRRYRCDDCNKLTHIRQ